MDRTINQRYETVFCIFLVALAFLYRDNATLVYPQILYLLAALLTMNFAAGIALRTWPAHPWAATGIIIGNCGVITALLNYSGGHESNLWVLYLLPIYTACLLLEGREIFLVMVGILSFNGAFYGLTVDVVDTTFAFNLLLKSGLFVFASAFTWKIAQKDLSARRKIARQRQEIAVIESKFLDQQTTLKENEALADIGHLTSGIAHDLGNPITVIVSTVQMLLEEEQKTVPFRQDLERIERAARLCKTITSNVLDLAKTTNMETISCDVNELIKNALQILGPTLQKSGITIEQSFASDLPSIEGSPAHLERIFLNLFSNAQGVMKNGGTLFITTKRVESPHQGPVWAQTIVEDTGPGFEAGVLAKIFKPFNSTKDAREGTGLGLYISREIANKHGGLLSAENRAEGGARFTLRLPAKQGSVISVPLSHPTGSLAETDLASTPRFGTNG